VTPSSPATAGAPGDDVWRLLARGERTAVLARLETLDPASGSPLARAVVDTVRATVLKARDAAAASAATDRYRGGDQELARATRLAANGRLPDSLRALWQAGDLFARVPPAASTAAPPRSTPLPMQAASASPPIAPAPTRAIAAAGGDPVATAPPPPTTAAPVASSLASPPAERPSVTAPPPAVPSAPTDPQLIADTLKRYDAAYEARDITALLRVFPSLGRGPVDQLKRTFDEMSSYEMDTRPTRVEVSGDTAVVQATVARRMSPRVGNPTANEVDTEFRLRRAGTGWVVSTVRAVSPVTTR
jgi:hypothetical protein